MANYLKGIGDSATRKNEILPSLDARINKFLLGHLAGIIQGELGDFAATPIDRGVVVRSGMMQAHGYFGLCDTDTQINFVMPSGTQYIHIYAEVDLSVVPNVFAIKTTAMSNSSAYTFRQDNLSTVPNGKYQLPLWQVTLTASSIILTDRRTFINKPLNAKNAEQSTNSTYAVNATNDANGANIVNNYAKQNGGYAGLTAGYANRVEYATTTFTARFGYMNGDGWSYSNTFTFTVYGLKIYSGTRTFLYGTAYATGNVGTYSGTSRRNDVRECQINGASRKILFAGSLGWFGSSADQNESGWGWWHRDVTGLDSTNCRFFCDQKADYESNQTNQISMTGICVEI